ncbi:hypothetical protein FQN51_008580 [Onygenales sp. PD_10]|nr:hypothetical protein FQN51_008580 [Onygenales sp. PD_10]
MNPLIFLILAASTTALPFTGRRELAQRKAAEACPIGYCLENGGTTGGGDATPIIVSDLTLLKQAASNDGPAVIIVTVIEGIGLEIKSASNVILRNLKIERVLYDAGDAISLNVATNVWIDHVDASGDLTANKDDYDGLLDITHASDWITVSNSYFHNHWKASLIGHSDMNGAEDEGRLHVTFANNYWYNVNSRTPSVRFGTVHVVNSFFHEIGSTGINARQKSQVLVQSSAFKDCADKAIFGDGSDLPGYIVVDDVDLGGSTHSPSPGTLEPDTLPYPTIESLGSAEVPHVIPGSVGQLL